MIQQTIFDIDQPLDKKKSVVTFDLPPSQQLFNIRSILSARKRKSSSSSSTPSSSSTSSVASSPSLTPASLPSHLHNKKQKLVFDDMISGLPSPPVESPKAEFPSLSNDSASDDTPPLTPNISSGITANSSSEHEGLSADDIKAKIAALREEKHNLFQLMKRLVEQEEQQQQQQQKKLKQQRQLEQQQQQQQQQDLKKKKVSRWSSSTPVGSFQKQQRHSPSPSPRAPFSNKPLNSRSSSFHFHPTATARPNGYFGQRPFSHRQPYLY